MLTLHCYNFFYIFLLVDSTNVNKYNNLSDVSQKNSRLSWSIIPDMLCKVIKLSLPPSPPPPYPRQIFKSIRILNVCFGLLVGLANKLWKHSKPVGLHLWLRYPASESESRTLKQWERIPKTFSTTLLSPSLFTSHIPVWRWFYHV